MMNIVAAIPLITKHHFQLLLLLRTSIPIEIPMTKPGMRANQSTNVKMKANKKSAMLSTC